MKLDLREVLAGVVSSLPISASVDMSREEVSCMLPNNISFLAPLSVEGIVTDNAGYTRLSIEVNGEYSFACDRCLADSVGTLFYTMERTVVREGVLANLNEDESDEYVVAHDGFIDVDELLIEETIISLPAKLVCSEDCLGLCPKCGKDLNHGNCDCSHKEIDPRLAPLAALLEKMKAEEQSED